MKLLNHEGVQALLLLTLVVVSYSVVAQDDYDWLDDHLERVEQERQAERRAQELEDTIREQTEDQQRWLSYPINDDIQYNSYRSGRTEVCQRLANGGYVCN